MKSTIRVEMDFNIKEPILQITLDKESSDLSDQTLRYFIERANAFGMEIRWPYDSDLHNTRPQIRIRQEIEFSVPTRKEQLAIKVDELKELLFYNNLTAKNTEEPDLYSKFFADVYARIVDL